MCIHCRIVPTHQTLSSEDLSVAPVLIFLTMSGCMECSGRGIKGLKKPISERLMSVYVLHDLKAEAKFCQVQEQFLCFTQQHAFELPSLKRC